MDIKDFISKTIFYENGFGKQSIKLKESNMWIHRRKCQDLIKKL